MDTVQKESVIVKRDEKGEIIAIVAYNSQKRVRELYKLAQADDDDWMELLKNKQNGQEMQDVQ